MCIVTTTLAALRLHSFFRGRHGSVPAPSGCLCRSPLGQLQRSCSLLGCVSFTPVSRRSTGSLSSFPWCHIRTFAANKFAKVQSRLRIELLEQRLCLFEIGRVETLREPGVDRCEEVAGFPVTTLVAAQPGEVCGGPQFPELGLLFLSDAEGFVVQSLGGLQLPLLKQNVAFLSVQLRCEPALPRPFDDLQSIVQQGQTLINLPCNL